MAKNNGLASLQARLAAIPAQVKLGIQPALQAGADEMIDQMKRFVPVDKGDLRDSIVATPAGQATPAHSQPGGSAVVPENAVAITAGNSAVRYAHFIEWGTRDRPAQPFFFPAYRLLRTKASRRVKRALSKAVKGFKNGGR